MKMNLFELNKKVKKIKTLCLFILLRTLLKIDLNIICLKKYSYVVYFVNKLNEFRVSSVM